MTSLTDHPEHHPATAQTASREAPIRRPRTGAERTRRPEARRPVRRPARRAAAVGAAAAARTGSRPGTATPRRAAATGPLAGRPAPSPGADDQEVRPGRRERAALESALGGPTVLRARRPGPRAAGWRRSRLTARGRALVVLVAVGVLLAVFAMGRTTAEATSPTGAPAARTVVVRPGQSLWSVAATADPQQDPRTTVAWIIAHNRVPGDVVLAGQRLLLPPG